MPLNISAGVTQAVLGPSGSLVVQEAQLVAVYP